VHDVLGGASAACTPFHGHAARARRVPSWCMVGTLRVARCHAYCTRAIQASLQSLLLERAVIVTRVCCVCAGSRRRRFRERRHTGARRQHDRQHREHYGVHRRPWERRVAVEVAVVTRGGCRETRADRSGPAEECKDSTGPCRRTRRCAERTIPLLLGRSPRWQSQVARSSLQTLVSMSRCATSVHLLRACVPLDALDWPCRVRCSPQTVPSAARSR
jgi:hypothetical protein